MAAWIFPEARLRRLRFLPIFFGLLALLVYSARVIGAPARGGEALLQALFAVLCLHLAALALGRALLRSFRFYFSSLAEEALYSSGLGLGALMLIGSALGALAALRPLTVWVTLGLCAILGLSHLEYFAAQLRRDFRSKRPWEGSSIEQGQLVAMALALAAALALSLAPVSFYDALVYHLAQPLRAAALGESGPRQSVLFTWLPAAAEQLWALLIAIGGIKAAALFNLSLALLSGLGLLDLGARLLPQRRLWLPPALFLTQPLAVLAFAVFGADGVCAFFALLSLTALLNSVAERNASLQGRWMALAFALAGVAVAVKPVALIHAGAILLVGAWLALAEPARRSPGNLALSVALFGLSLLPWMAQGLLLRDNPLYPFGLSLFGVEWLPSASSAYFEHLKDFGPARDLLGWARLPWDLTFKPSAFGGGGNLSFLFLGVLPAIFFVSYSAQARALGLYSALGLLLWSGGPRVLRYMLPLLPGLCLLLAWALLELERWARSASWALALRLLVVLALGLGASRVLLLVVRDFDPFAVALGLEDESSYLVRRGVQYAPAAHWLRLRYPSAKVLVLGDSRVAYLPPRAEAGTVFERHPLRGWLARAKSPEDVGALLRGKGYDFVLVNFAEWARVASQPGPAYQYFSTPAVEAQFRAWVESARQGPRDKTYDDRAVVVLPLR